MAKNRDYWAKRMQALEDEQYRRSEAYYRDVQKQFRMASNNLQMEIEHWYGRLAENNGISYASAKKFLKASELEEFRWTVEDYIKAGRENAVDQRWMKQLENASAKYHISYLSAMKLQIQQHAELLFSEFEGGLTDYLHNDYAEQFYRTAYEVSKGAGVGFNLSRLDEGRIDQLIKRPWAQDGKAFSDRIWSNKEKLVNTLHTELAQCLIRGEPAKAAAGRLAERMGVSQNQAANLVMTESAAISSAAQKQCFRELGVDRYQFDATLDGRTCDFCQEMDQKVFGMSEFEIGVTVPPVHPRCRCCVVPYFDDWDELGISVERSARDPETEKTVWVDGNLKYREWKERAIYGRLEDTTDKWSREAKKELLADERAISVRQKEIAVVYGPDGEFLFQKRGVESEVRFSWSEWRRLKGSVISHNHPSGASFSRQDILTLFKSSAAEIRVATENGSYYMRAPKRWPKEISSGEKIEETLEKIAVEVRRRYQQLYEAGKISKTERHRQSVHETNAVFAERYGLDYGKEEYE